MSPHLAQVMGGGEAWGGGVLGGEGEMLRRILHKCSYVHAAHKSTAFCMLILSELKKNTEQLHVEVLCTEFDSNRTKSAESRMVIHFCP
jgi:hypothetical protein